MDVMGKTLPARTTINHLRPAPKSASIGSLSGREGPKVQAKPTSKGSSSSSESSGSDHYVVEKIVDHKQQPNGGYSYLVKWKGWNEDSNSWVAQGDFDGLALINKYWKELGQVLKAAARVAKKK